MELDYSNLAHLLWIDCHFYPKLYGGDVKLFLGDGPLDFHVENFTQWDANPVNHCMWSSCPKAFEKWLKKESNDLNFSSDWSKEETEAASCLLRRMKATYQNA